jgi:D-cysteine desulfhydrase
MGAELGSEPRAGTPEPLRRPPALLWAAPVKLEIDLERVPLGDGPTPVRELTHLGEGRGRAPLWLKDDGAYSAFGGNKARKLEWLLAAATHRRKRTILTGGALGTNHGLATALFARRLGMRTVLVLVPQPETEHVRGQLARMREAGAELHFPRTLPRAYLLAAGLFVGRASLPLNFPYFLRPGGSVPLGCVGYVEAAIELFDQVGNRALPAPSHVVVALGSGGTAAGLAAGLKLAGMRSRLVGVLVNDLIRVDAGTVARLARRTLRLLGRHGVDVNGVDVSPHDVDVEGGWLGHGYGHSTSGGERATELLRSREGVALEPVYTAKAMAATLELNRRGAFGDGPVLFWHTYGPPREEVIPAGDGVAGTRR